MKATIDGKRYDTANCEHLAEYDRYSNGNYCGFSRLMLASNGVYLIQRDTNGQDGYYHDSLVLADHDAETPREFLEGIELDDKQEARLVELGILKLVD